MEYDYTTYNFCIRRNEDKNIVFNFFTSDDTTETPLVLSGNNYELLLGDGLECIDYASTGNGRIQLGKTTENGFISTTYNATCLQVIFPRTVTKNYKKKAVQYELVERTLDDKRKILLVGNVAIHDGINYE